MKSILSIMLFVLFFSVSVNANISSIEVQENIRVKLQNALDVVYGPGNFIINVNVKMSAARYSLKYTNQSKVKTQSNKNSKNVFILPGYPALKNFASGNQLPFESTTTFIEPNIRRVNIDLIVNRKFSKGKVGQAQQLIKSIVGFKAGRDRLNVTFKPFFGNDVKPQEIIIKGNDEKLLSFQNLFYLLFVIMTLLFIVLYVVFQNKILKAAKKSDDDSGGGGPSISVNPNIELPESDKGGGPGGNIELKPAPNIKQYFDFISAENVDVLKNIMEKDKLPLDQIKLIISFIKPELARYLILSYDTNKQAVLSAAILDSQQGNRGVIEKLEKRIKDQIECMVGGQDSFNSIFKNVSSATKKQILDTLNKSNPVGYKKFRASIVIFDDFKFLTDDEMSIILSEVNLEQLATALATSDDSLKQKINSNLTGSANDMLNQYLEMKGTDTPVKEIESAQEAVLKLILKFENEGKIKLKEKIQA